MLNRILYWVTIFSFALCDGCIWMESGYHCNGRVSLDLIANDVLFCNSSGQFDQLANQTIAIDCVKCFIPHRCLEENQCVDRTAGPTCERCAKIGETNDNIGYYSVGSGCLKCSEFPWAMVIFILALTPVCFALVWFKGFSVSIYTKLSMLINFVQLTLVTLLIHKDWPDQILKALNFGSNYFACAQNLSLNPDVILWILISTILTISLAACIGVDRRFIALICKENDIDRLTNIWSWKRHCRRTGMFIGLAFFMPVCRGYLKSMACAAVIPARFSFGQNDLYLYDQDENISCGDASFQLLNFILAMLILLGYLPFFFTLLIFTLRLYKWDLFKEYTMDFGFVFESYKKRACFWDAVILLRKFLCVVLTAISPLSAIITSSAFLGLSSTYLIITIIFRPYNKYIWRRTPEWLDIHNIFEVFSTIVLMVFHLGMVLESASRSPDSHSDHQWGRAALILIIVTLCIWYIMFVLVPLEEKAFVEEEPEIPVLSKREHRLQELWVRNQDGEGLDSTMVTQRRMNLNL